MPSSGFAINDNGLSFPRIVDTNEFVTISTTLATAITVTGSQSINVVSTTGMLVDQLVSLDTGASSEIVQIVSIVDATHFTAVSLKLHAASSVVGQKAQRQTTTIASPTVYGNQAEVDANGRLSVAKPIVVYTAQTLTISGAVGSLAMGPYNTLGANRMNFGLVGPSPISVSLQGSFDGITWKSLYGHYSGSAWIPLDYIQLPADGAADVSGFAQVRFIVAQTSGGGTVTSTNSISFADSPINGFSNTLIVSRNGGSSYAQTGGSGLLVAVNDSIGVPLTNMNGALAVASESGLATYHASYTALTGIAGINVLLTASSKTVKIRRISVSGFSSPAITVDVSLNKYTASPSGGTTVTPAVIVPSFASDTSGSTVAGYSAQPTGGTLKGTVRSWTQTFPVSGVYAVPIIYESSNIADKALTLMGESLGVVLSAGMTHLNISLTWTET